MPLIGTFTSPVNVSAGALMQTFDMVTGKFIPGTKIDGPGGLYYVSRTGPQHNNKGTDIKAPPFSAVKAIGPGKVVTVATVGSAGLHVEINHEDGWASRYLHLSGTQVVKDQYVTRGERIGSVGRTGNATAYIVHLDLFKHVPPGTNNIFGYSGKTRVEAMAFLSTIGLPSLGLQRAGGLPIVQGALWASLGLIGFGVVFWAAYQYHREGKS